jgi:hypothetical protein
MDQRGGFADWWLWSSRWLSGALDHLGGLPRGLAGPTLSASGGAPVSHPIDEVADWLGAGLTADEAAAQRARGITAEQAAALRVLPTGDEPTTPAQRDAPCAPPRAAPVRGVPRGDIRGVGRVRGALRQEEGRARLVRTPLRDSVRPRACMPQVPDAPHRTGDGAAAERTRRRPPRASRPGAEREGWLGEIEGLDLTLGHLRAKRERAQRLTGASPVLLPMPTTRA